jgi:hypothetical protein
MGSSYIHSGNTADSPWGASSPPSTSPPNTAQLGSTGVTVPSGSNGKIPTPRQSQNYIGFQPITATGRGEKRPRGHQQQSSTSSGVTQIPAHLARGQIDLTPTPTPPSSQSIPSAPASQAEETASLRTSNSPLPSSQPVDSPDAVARVLPTESLMRELFERMHANGGEGGGGAPPGYQA